MFRVGSLFSGVGGMDLGLERAGMKVYWQVEIDPYCRKVLAKHWPDVPRYEDVRDVGAAKLGPVDLICGGFPCQPTSHIGKRARKADERWLWPEFARILREMGPRYALLENPTGLLAGEMGDVLGDLAEIGYDAEWTVLPAALFGARHKRDRAFVVAYAAGNGLEGRDGAPEERWRRPILRAEALPESPVRWDITEPAVCRASDGIPARVDRLRALGNAVVPQVAEWIGRQILRCEVES